MCPLHASLSYCASVQAPFYLQDVNLRLKVLPHLQIHPLKQLPGTLSSSEPDHVVPSKHVFFLDILPLLHTVTISLPSFIANFYLKCK